MELESLRNTIDKFGLNPKKSLGQNFILDQNITDKIVKHANINSEDKVLEIGPGPGGLTRSILKANPQNFIVIEQDERCIKALHELKTFYPKLEIIHGDAIKVKEEELSPKDTKIIANLPYNIGTVLLFKWLENITYFKSLTLMFQKEVAMRIIASPRSKDYGRLSVMAQTLCEVDHHFDLKPDVFFPPPKVTSSVISLYPKKIIPEPKIIKAIEKIARITFSMRRKMLKTSLKILYDEPEKLLEGTNIKVTQRPEELSVADFNILAERYLYFTIK